MYIVIKVVCKTWNQGLSHSWNVLKPHWGIPTCQRHEMYKILFTLCVNTSISLSTEYLHRLYVICPWDKSSWCDLQIRKKYWSNGFCLVIHFASSLLLDAQKLPFTKLISLYDATKRNHMVTDLFQFAHQSCGMTCHYL